MSMKTTFLPPLICAAPLTPNLPILEAGVPVTVNELVIAWLRSPTALPGTNALSRGPGLLAGGDRYQLDAAIIFHHPGQAHQQLLVG